MRPSRHRPTPHAKSALFRKFDLNSYQIGVNGEGNVVNVNANSSGNPHVQLEIDESTIQKKSITYYKKESLSFWSKSLPGIISFLIGLLADIIGISKEYGLKWILIIAGVGLIIWAAKHFRSWYIYRNLPRKKDSACFVGNNQVVEADNDGMVYLYSRHAKCIYPNCDGSIILAHAPPREVGRLGKTFVGICSICGKDHSYELDYIWNAYPQKFDWRPIDAAPKA
jgi:hypothetical protein